MPGRPRNQTVRPFPGDPLSDILASTQLHSSALANFFFSAPWAVDCEHLPTGTPFHAVVSGKCQIRLPDREPLWLHPGDLVLLPRWARHTLAASDEGRPVSIREVFELNGVPIQEPSRPNRGPIQLVYGGGMEMTHILSGVFFFRDRQRNPILNTLPEHLHFKAGEGHLAPWLDTALRVLGEEAMAPRPGFSEMARRLADLLLVEMLRSYITGHPAQVAGWLQALIDPRLGRALQRVHADPGRRWTIHGLARESGMSRSHFAARFRRMVGETPLAYVAGWRMHLAMEQLASASMPIPAIATGLGYTSEISFAKAFKRRVGESPGQFRRQRRRPESARATR
jgi:AraC-like DNA-binding protein